MKPVSVPLLAGLGVGAAVLAAILSEIKVDQAGNPLIVTPFVTVLFALLGIWLLVAGRAVQRLKAKEQTWISPVTAGRTAILARASAYVSSVFSGAMLGVSMVGFTRLGAPAMSMSAWTALAGGLAALFAAIVSVIVERWCVDEDGDGDVGKGKKSAPDGRRPSPSA